MSEERAKQDQYARNLRRVVSVTAARSREALQTRRPD